MIHHFPSRCFAACVLLVLHSSEGFLPASPIRQSILSSDERTFSSTVEDTAATEVVEAETEPEVSPINGWVPDESKPCFGLPGAVAPTGFFDPLGFCQVGIPINDVKRYREAEVQHGRVPCSLPLVILLVRTLVDLLVFKDQPTISWHSFP